MGGARGIGVQGAAWIEYKGGVFGVWGCEGLVKGGHGVWGARGCLGCRCARGVQGGVYRVKGFREEQELLLGWQRAAKFPFLAAHPPSAAAGGVNAVGFVGLEYRAEGR